MIEFYNGSNISHLKESINQLKQDKKDIDDIHGQMLDISRSIRYKHQVSIDDKKIILINKETKERYNCFQNTYDCIYYFDEDDIFFLREDSLNKYEIEEI